MLNVCIIVVDALRAKNLSCYGYEKMTSPNIDAFSKGCTLFENCFSTTNTTDSSFTTILSGKYPLSHGIIQHGDKVNQNCIEELSHISFLQSILKSKGYVTIAIDWLGRWHKKDFDVYSGPISSKKKKIAYRFFSKLKMESIVPKIGSLMSKLKKHHIMYYDKAEIVTDYALKMLEKYKNRKFFLFIHYWDTHIPYDPPEFYLKKFQNEEYKVEIEKVDDILDSIKNDKWKNYMKRWIDKTKNIKDLLAMYDAEVNYVDSQIGRLIQNMDKLGVLDNTILVITSDHGESLTEHGIYFDHHGLYDVNIHVPLIIYYPNKIPKGKKINALIQHTDIVPTILDLLDFDYKGFDFDGESLIPFLNNKDSREFIFVEEAYTQKKFAIRTKRFKYIFAPSKKHAVCRYCGRIHGAIEELYDLKKDPEEKLNIANNNPQVRLELSRKMTNFIKKLKNKKEKRNLKRKINNLKLKGV